MAFFLFVTGLCIGSFVNVAVLRSGFDERGSERSRCMSCEASIPWYDLLPVVSYAALSGRCRACGSTLSIQYPLVELGCGASFMLAYLAMPPVLGLWSVMTFVALLFSIGAVAALVAYDLKHFLVPAPFAIALLASAVATAVFRSLYAGSFTPLYESAVGGTLLAAFFAAIVLGTKGKGMGMGDAYVAGAIGLILGPVRGFEAIMIGIWTGTAVALVILLLSSLLRKTRLLRTVPRVTMKTELPLVPFLAFGLGMALFTGFSPLALLMPLSNLIVSGHP